jgi:hypothetical protein
MCVIVHSLIGVFGNVLFKEKRDGECAHMLKSLRMR